MATLVSSRAPHGLSLLTAPLRALAEAVNVLRSAQRAAHLADKLYHHSDEQLAAKGLSRDAISARILAELDGR